MFEPNITLNRIASSISHTLGLPYDDFLNQKIKFMAINYRSTLLRQDQARNNITKSFLIPLPCLELVCVDVAQCCGGNKSFENALKTVEKVPNPLRNKESESFYYIGGIDKMTPYTETTFTDFINTKHLRFTSNLTRYIWLDGDLYIVNPPDGLKYITVIDPFEDVTQVYNIKDCNGTKCYTDDDTFPIGGDMYGILETYILGQLRNSPLAEDKEIKINDN